MNRFNWRYFIASTLIICLLAPINFSIDQIPITLQTFVLFTVAAVFGKYHALYATLIYLLLGALGLPVYGGYSSGWEKLIGPTAGFLWAFPLVVYFVGWRTEKSPKTYFHFILIFLAAHFLLLIPGFIVLYFTVEQIKLWDTFIRLAPGLLIKSFLGGITSLLILKKLLQHNATEA